MLLSPIPLLTLIGFAMQSVLLGVSWGAQNMPGIPLVTLAIALPPLTSLVLSEMIDRSGMRDRVIIFVGIAVLLIAGNASLFLGIGSLLYGFLAAVYALFGMHLIWLGLHLDPSKMARCPLHSFMPAPRIHIIAGTIMLISAIIELAAALDLQSNGGLTLSVIVCCNLTLLLGLVTAFFIGHDNNADNSMTSTSQQTRQSSSDDQQEVRAPSQGNEDNTESILAKLDHEMRINHLYRNESLSLNEIARKIRVPARQVSAAVNTLQGMNVPKYVNSYRIRDACRLLEETDIPVTEVIFAVGFTTKSNFNREFHRVTGLSPSAWRSRALAGTETMASPSAAEQLRPTTVHPAHRM